MLCLHVLSHLIFTTLCEVDTLVIFLVQMKEMRLKVVKQTHQRSDSIRLNLNPKKDLTDYKGP